MAEPKPLAPSASKAVQAVLKQQKEGNYWNGKCHRFALGYLAEQFIESGKLDRTAFASALDSEPWTFSSNMKKRLESLELIPNTGELGESFE